jgi:hypothetical protein
VQAADLVHLPVLPVRDAGARGGSGAHQGAAPCHDLVHLQDTLLAQQLQHGGLGLRSSTYLVWQMSQDGSCDARIEF